MYISHKLESFESPITWWGVPKAEQADVGLTGTCLTFFFAWWHLKVFWRVCSILTITAWYNTFMWHYTSEFQVPERCQRFFFQRSFWCQNRDIFEVSTSDLEIAIFQVGFDGLVTVGWGKWRTFGCWIRSTSWFLPPASNVPIWDECLITKTEQKKGLNGS